MNRARYDRSRFLLRRQFALGPRFLKGFPTWKRSEVSSGLYLTAHPDLPLCRVVDGERSITLLGYLLDPWRPADCDLDIAQRLLRHLDEGGTRERLIRLTYPMGGRWILLVDTGSERWLFHDACGHRQLFYTDAPHPLWCAAQPGVLAAILGLSENQETLRFYRTYRTRDPQYSWPGDTSPFPGVRRLQANHLLDLRMRTVRRYWPQGDLEPRSTREALEENVRLLEGIVESASHRFSLALAVTSGRDTRTLLAASKSIRDRVYFFTSMWGHMGWQTADIRIPSKLLPELGLTHHVVGCPPRADKEFDRILRESVATAHACYAPIIQGEAQGELPTRVGMLGIGMPVLKVPYRRRLKRWRPQADLQNLDAETIAWCGYRTDSFSHEAIRRWLSDVPRTNVHVLDLFYWEEREGGFEAMTLTEWDLARESFSPYSCRRFMENALSVPESHRSEPEYLFHQELIGRMWPQVLQEPFNPHDEPDIFVTVFTGLTQLREKIDRRSPPSMGLPVVRFFQRYPWLADLRRIGWPLAETRKFLEVRNPNSIDPGPPSQQARNPAASSEPENPGASAAHAAQPVSGDGGGGHRET